MQNYNDKFTTDSYHSVEKKRSTVDYRLSTTDRIDGHCTSSKELAPPALALTCCRLHAVPAVQCVSAVYSVEGTDIASALYRRVERIKVRCTARIEIFWMMK